MNPSMMATRNALPLSNPATLMYIARRRRPPTQRRPQAPPTSPS
ncbi:hypothetical protein GQ600_10472 [Phytophthora cactorum]|nr:hypothetical protein GQ600_10472 [Phytophthora cactorum]